MEKYSDRVVLILISLICTIYSILIWLGWFSFVAIIMIARDASFMLSDRPVESEFDLALKLLPLFAIFNFLYYGAVSRGLL